MILKQFTVQLEEFWKKIFALKLLLKKRSFLRLLPLLSKWTRVTLLTMTQKLCTALDCFLCLSFIFLMKLLLSSFVYSCRRECMKDRIVLVSCLLIFPFQEVVVWWLHFFLTYSSFLFTPTFFVLLDYWCQSKPTVLRWDFNFFKIHLRFDCKILLRFDL